jgi:hypothetical protein
MHDPRLLVGNDTQRRRTLSLRAPVSLGLPVRARQPPHDDRADMMISPASHVLARSHPLTLGPIDSSPRTARASARAQLSEWGRPELANDVGGVRPWAPDRGGSVDWLGLESHCERQSHMGGDPCVNERKARELQGARARVLVNSRWAWAEERAGQRRITRSFRRVRQASPRRNLSAWRRRCPWCRRVGRGPGGRPR